MTSSPSLSTQRRIVWGVRVLLALAFGAAGAAKLAGVPQMVQVFDAIGAGQWFRYVTGAVEVVGAVLILIRATGFFGALLLTATMVGAVATHLVLIGGSPMPAVVLGLLAAFVAWRLRPAFRPGAAY
ncbi:DoxX family protein [Pseudoxanthomonas sp. UTMC 1351]|uniref:DoxX family protein n=1 Tax=Pseudoxanthomonas sp. UTMC 1351 TaxID=2695853 RepID=UPI0034CD5A3B